MQMKQQNVKRYPSRFELKPNSLVNFLMHDLLILKNLVNPVPGLIFPRHWTLDIEHWKFRNDECGTINEEFIIPRSSFIIALSSSFRSATPHENTPPELCLAS